MSAVEVYIEGDEAHIIDDRGHGTIPVRAVHMLAYHAEQDDDERAQWPPESGRWFHRDNLASARTLLDHRDACTFTSPAGDCDEAAVFDLADARPKCDNHKKD